MNTNVRPRVMGALMLIMVFVAGAMSGIAFTRIKPAGINVNVRMVTTKELPRELRDLGLTKTQEDTLRQILNAGERRTLRVLNDFEPRLQQAMDSLDAEIHAALTPEQRTKFDETRKTRVKTEVDRVIDTVRK